MKRMLSVLLTGAALLTLAACKNSAAMDATTSATAQTQTAPAAPLDAKQPLVYSLVEQEDFRLPVINLDCPAAKEINKAIAETQPEEYRTNDYAYMVNGNVLSLVTWSTDPWDGIYFTAYNLNIQTGAPIPNLELLQLAGFTEESYFENLRERVTFYFDAFLEDDGSLPPYIEDLNYSQSREIALSPARSGDRHGLSVDFPLFLNEENHLCAVLLLEAFGGADGGYEFVFDTSRPTNEFGQLWGMRTVD
ncbi:MAG: hypothetical protein LBS96_08700 [Oscillospiraceae bacterium]|jgi:hypothetical protein|nr:hypothetical protein [Oscillospiraceae bacterium]